MTTVEPIPEPSPRVLGSRAGLVRSGPAAAIFLLWACACGGGGAGASAGEAGSESETGADCGSAVLEVADFSLTLASEGNTYVQASMSIRLENRSATQAACPSIDRVHAIFGFDGEDAVALDLAEPHSFVLEPGEQLDSTISASRFDALPPNLFADHCQPETQGVLQVWSSETSMPMLETVPLPIGCACC